MSKKLTIFLVIFFSLALVFTFLAIKYINDNKEEVNDSKPQYSAVQNQNIKPNIQESVSNDNPSSNIAENNNLTSDSQEISVDKNQQIMANNIEGNYVANNTPTDTKQPEAPRKNIIIRIIEALLEKLGLIRSDLVNEDDINRYNDLAKENQDIFDEFGNPYIDTVPKDKNNVEVVVSAPELKQDIKPEPPQKNTVELAEVKVEPEDKVEPEVQTQPQENIIALPRENKDEQVDDIAEPQEIKTEQIDDKIDSKENKITELENLVEQLKNKVEQLENKVAEPQNTAEQTEVKVEPEVKTQPQENIIALPQENKDEQADDIAEPQEIKVEQEEDNVQPEENKVKQEETKETTTPEDLIAKLQNVVDQLENKLAQLDNKAEQKEDKVESMVKVEPEEIKVEQAEDKIDPKENKIAELENLVEQLENKLSILENKKEQVEDKVASYNPLVQAPSDGSPLVKRYVYVPRLSTQEGTEHLRGILEQISTMETFNTPIDTIKQLEGVYDSNKAPVKLTNDDKKIYQDAVHWLISEKEKELIDNNKFEWSTYNYEDNLDITFDVLSRNYLKTKVRWVVKVEDPIIALRWFDDNTRSWKRIDTIDSKYAVIVNELPNDIYGIICIRQSVDGYNWSPITIKCIDVEKETADSYFDTVSKI